MPARNAHEHTVQVPAQKSPHGKIDGDICITDTSGFDADTPCASIARKSRAREHARGVTPDREFFIAYNNNEPGDVNSACMTLVGFFARG